MEKSTCPKCGRVNEEGSKHCSKCRAVLNPLGKDLKPNQRIVEAGFIPHGQETSAHDLKPKTEIFTPGVKANYGKDNPSPVWVFGKVTAILLVIAAIGGGLWYYNGKDDLLSKIKASIKYREGSTVAVYVPKDNYIPFCKDRAEVRLFYHSFKIGDEYEIDNMLKDKRMLYLDYNTKLLVLKKDMAYAQVRVLEGPLKGMAGWVYLVEVSQFDRAG